jgi:hypothetical protein
MQQKRLNSSIDYSTQARSLSMAAASGKRPNALPPLRTSQGGMSTEDQIKRLINGASSVSQAKSVSKEELLKSPPAPQQPEDNGTLTKEEILS